MSNALFGSIETAIEDIKNGKMIVVVDDEDRENEGDLLMAAHHVTPEAINFMATCGRGLICMPLSQEMANRLDLNEMVSVNTEQMGTAFTVSVDATSAHGVTTGISASDRAKTIQVILNNESTTMDIDKPGHIFPLLARKMGVLRRAGHTEAAVDLARLAGLESAGVICEIMKDDGEMARVPDLQPFCQQHQLTMITIKDLIQYRLQHETFVELIEVVNMPTEYGLFKLHLFEDIVNNVSHVALVKGEVSQECVVRVQSEDFDNDMFRATKDNDRSLITKAMTYIEKESHGVIVYIRKNESIPTDAQSDRDNNDQDTMLREYGVGAQILRKLGVTSFQLLTNSDRKIVGLDGFGLSCTKRLPIE